MKIGLRIVGICMMLAGAVWVLQGINILPGSFMTGQMEWAVYGVLTMAAAIALFIFAGRR
jgi:hypothetical protein